MGGSTINTFKQNDIILGEGQINQCLFQVASGTVRVQLNSNNNVVVVNTLGRGTMFGETTFLEGGNSGATADVVADEDDVQIYLIEVLYIL